MATTLKDIISTVTQGGYFTQLMAGHKKNGVPVASWTSPRNTGLSLTQIAAQFFAVLRGVVSSSVAGLFLDYAVGVALTLFVRSQYQLERTPAQFAQGWLVLTAVAGAPVQTFGPGDLTAGTPGNTAATRLFTNLEGGTLQPGLSVPGVDAAGLEQGGTFTPKTSGVTLQVVVAGLNTALSVPVVVGKAVVVNAATDAAGNPISTVAQISAAIAARPSALALVGVTSFNLGSAVIGQIPQTSLDLGTLVLKFTATAPGSAWNLPVGSPLDLKTSIVGVSIANPAWIGGTWISSQGAEEESDDRLKLRAPARWGTLGVGGNDDAFLFWALAVPNGYSSSPVSQAVVLASFYQGAFHGAGATVVIIGPAGALGGGDVAAVQANFEAPVLSLAGGPVPGLELLRKKYPIGCLVQVVSAANLTVTITGTVSILRSAGVSVADVQAAVTAALAAYQLALRIGQRIYARKLAGVIEQAAPFATAIRDADLSAMTQVTIPTILQYPLLSAAGLIYQPVDQ